MASLQLLILTRRIKMQGFIVSDHYDRFNDFVGDVSTWLNQGQLKYKEHVVAGLENAPEAFLRLFSGDKFGKLIVQVGAQRI